MSTPFAASAAASETAIVIPRIAYVAIGEMAAAAAGEVAPRRPDVARLLRQPAEPVRDLRLVLRRRPAIRLAVGRDRPVQVAVADPGRRDVPPGRVGGRRLGQLEDRLPGPDGAVLVVHPVAGLGHPEEGRAGDLGIVEADDALVGGERLGVVPGLEQRRSLVEERRDGLAGSAAP